MEVAWRGSHVLSDILNNFFVCLDFVCFQIPQVNPSKRAFEQGNQQVQQNSLTSPYQGVSGSQTNFVAPPIPGQQVGIMHSKQREMK